MSLSKRAKRGISIFSKIQWNPLRAIYHLSQKRMIDLNVAPPADLKLVSAASEAMEILVKNWEAANAISTVSDNQENAVPKSPESGAELSVPEKQENGEGC